jgi:hypothetical protein
MVDILALSLPHALMLIAVWRLLSRDDLDTEAAPAEPEESPRA